MTGLLADENVPMGAVRVLRDAGLDVVSVAEVSPGVGDRAVIERACGEGRVIVTFDKDFGELIFRERMNVVGLILLRFAPSSPGHVAERIRHAVSQVSPLENRLVVVEEDRVRVTALGVR